jgi:hypothetical protein
MPAHKAGEIIFCVEAVQHHPHLKKIATIKRCFWQDIYLFRYTNGLFGFVSKTARKRVIYQHVIGELITHKDCRRRRRQSEK